MDELTMEDAICCYPNMVIVLRCFAPLLKDKVSKVLMMPDVADAAYMCVDSELDSKQLFEFYNSYVPKYIVHSDIGGAPVMRLKPTIPDDFFVDVTDIAKEIWNEV